MLYDFAVNFLKVLLRVFGKLHVFDRHYLPDKGPYVLACTHSGWVEILYLGISILPSRIHYMAKKQLFQNKLFAWLLKELNAFPVDRDNPGPSVLKIPHKLLSNGEIVGIFPSGTRSAEQTALKQGAITIAQRSQVPIIPVAYKGPNNLKDLVLRKKASLIFGESIQLSSKDKESRTYYLNILEQRLKSLEEKL